MQALGAGELFPEALECLLCRTFQKYACKRETWCLWSTMIAALRRFAGMVDAVLVSEVEKGDLSSCAHSAYLPYAVLKAKTLQWVTHGPSIYR